MDDQTLINLLQRGDQASFKILFDRYKTKVYNTTLIFLRNAEDAEEATQDVFVEVFRSAASYKQDASVSTWIYKIAVNKSLDRLRHQKRKKRMSFLVSLFSKDNETYIDVPHFDHPGIELEKKEKAQILFSVIDALPEQQKSAFLLSQVEDLPQKEIAVIMDVSEKAVESLIQRAKVNLRKKLEIFNPSRRN